MSIENYGNYQLIKRIATGGIAQIYLARRLGRSTLVPDIVCIKVSQRIDGWLREAYFGQLLDGHARAEAAAFDRHVQCGERRAEAFVERFESIGRVQVVEGITRDAERRRRHIRRHNIRRY